MSMNRFYLDEFLQFDLRFLREKILVKDEEYEEFYEREIKTFDGWFLLCLLFIRNAFFCFDIDDLQPLLKIIFCNQSTVDYRQEDLPKFVPTDEYICKSNESISNCFVLLS